MRIRTWIIAAIFIAAIFGCKTADVNPDSPPLERYPERHKDYELFSRDEPRAGGFYVVLLSRSDEDICVPVDDWPVPQWLVQDDSTAYRLGSIPGWPSAVTVISEGERFPLRQSNLGHDIAVLETAPPVPDPSSFGNRVEPNGVLVGFIPYEEFQGNLNTDPTVSRTLEFDLLVPMFCREMLDGYIWLRNQALKYGGYDKIPDFD